MREEASLLYNKYTLIFIIILSIGVYASSGDNKIGAEDAAAPVTKDDNGPLHFAAGAWGIPHAITNEIARPFRDPSSTIFGDFDLYRSVKIPGFLVKAAVACGEVNTKNGFGGYTGMQKFVAILGSGVTLVDLGRNNNQAAQRLFVRTWNKLCTGRS